jgi:hypothetical protein
LEKAGIKSSLCAQSNSSYNDKNEAVMPQVGKNRDIGYEISPDKVIFFDKPPLMQQNVNSTN